MFNFAAPRYCQALLFVCLSVRHTRSNKLNIAYCQTFNFLSYLSVFRVKRKSALSRN